MSPPDWPNPPWWIHLTLESPWALATALVAAAAAMYVVGGRRGQPSLQRCSFLPALAAVAMIITAATVQTDREQILHSLNRLAQAFEDPFDMKTVRALAADPPGDRKPAALVGMAEQVQRRVKILDHHFTRRRVHVETDTFARTYVAVIGRLQARQIGGGGYKAQALMEWRKDSSGTWQISRIQDLWVNDNSARKILSSYVH
ncbi:MAG: hypothetical protein OER86_01550 [Phycisphaerae bacterium]|nr:hypothetical protein [Phycisphaerae bacterium]